MQRIDESEDVVDLICRWLNRKGFDAKKIPATKTPDYKHRMQHTDDGDIAALIKGKQQRVEVKGSSKRFDSIESYPYPTVIIDEAYKVTKEHTLPLYGYVIVNKQRTGFLAIPFTTKEHWYTSDKFDSIMQQKRKFMICNKKHVAYVNIGKSNG